MPAFRKILCAIDFSKFSLNALRYSALMAREFRSRLIILHCVAEIPGPSDVDPYGSKELYEDLSRVSKNEMETLVSKIVPAEIKTTRMVRVGYPSEIILRVSQVEDADLVVMGSHGRAGFERFLVGSVTSKVLRKSIVPVLVCHPSNPFKVLEDQKLNVDTILCPIDFGKQAERVKDLAFSIAKDFHAKLIFLHISALSPKGAKLNQLDKLKRFVGSRDAECVVQAGDVTEKILEVLESREIQLVVMGHHTQIPLVENFLGSVARRIVSESPCPVLIERSRKF
jgi:nucleotide-binding universal stress UspA family protein